MIKYGIFLILLFAQIDSARAAVDMKNANFSDYWVDLMIPGNNYLMRISRNYSSRSLFNGIFGFGWCSQIESHLDITLEGNLVLSECGTGQTQFYPANYNTQLINDSVEKIISLLKKNGPDKGKKYYETLRDELRVDHKLRTQYAGDLGFKISPIKNTVFLMNGKEVDKIHFDGNLYIRNLPDGTLQKFDSSGKLTYLFDKQKNFLKFIYSGNQLSQLVDSSNHKLTFSYSVEKKVKQIVAGNGMIVKYKFNGENLVGVTNAWQNNYTYGYDQNHNLIKIDFPDGTNKTLSYIENKDWVREFKDRDSCVETYEFTMAQDNPKDHYWSTAVKNCKGKTVFKSRYEFWYQSRPDKEKYLSRVVSEKNSQILDISFHQDFGKPIAVRKNADVTTFQYLSNGFLKQKTVSLFIPQNDETQKFSMLFDYDNENRIEATTTEFFSKSGKSLKRKKTTFKYDSANRLILAKNSDGQFVDIKYNPQGLIASIADQTKKEVLIEYDSKTLKPTTLVRPSVGSIQLAYTPTGDLMRVQNRDGSSVNSQVFAAFNNFIDMVGPVSTELSLNL